MKERFKFTYFSICVSLFTMLLASLTNDTGFITIQALWCLFLICVVFIMESILKKR